MPTTRYSAVLREIQALDWIAAGVWAFNGLLFLSLGIAGGETILWAVGLQFLLMVLPIHTLSALHRAKRGQSGS